MYGKSWHNFFDTCPKDTSMAGAKKKIPLRTKKPKGVPIPAGTEQETGLTRAQTEKPGAKRPRDRKKENLSKKIS
jgi:hypothetical protein